MATTKAGSPTKKTVKKMPARAPATKRATAANKANKKVATKKAASATPQQATRSTAMTASKRPASKVSTRKPAAKRAATTKTATTTTAASKAMATKTAAKKAATQRASAADHAPARTSTAKTVGKAARKMPASATATAGPSQTRSSPRTATSGDSSRKPRKITPQQALANTHELLDAKREHERQPQPWQALDPVQSHIANAGFQSPSAMEKAEELHAGESRQAAIQGSISTQDRHNQGKRDNR